MSTKNFTKFVPQNFQSFRKKQVWPKPPRYPEPNSWFDSTCERSREIGIMGPLPRATYRFPPRKPSWWRSPFFRPAIPRGAGRVGGEVGWPAINCRFFRKSSAPPKKKPAGYVPFLNTGFLKNGILRMVHKIIPTWLGSISSIKTYKP